MESPVKHLEEQEKADAKLDKLLLMYGYVFRSDDGLMRKYVHKHLGVGKQLHYDYLYFRFGYYENREYKDEAFVCNRDYRTFSEWLRSPREHSSMELAIRKLLTPKINGEHKNS